MKKAAPRTLKITGATLGVLVLAVVIGEVSGWPFLRSPLQNAVSKATGVPVLLEGRFRTRLIFNPQMSVEHLNVGAGGGVQVPHLVDGRGVELAWRWRDLWNFRQGQDLWIQRVRAASIDAHLVRTADGKASWQLGSGEKKPPPDPQADPLAGVPHFGMLIVDKGLVVVDDVPSRTQLRIDIAGREGERLPDGTPAGYQAGIKGRWQALPLQLQVSAGGSLPLLDDDVSAAPVPVRIEGTAGAASMLFDGTAGALLGARRLNGALLFKGPSLAQVGEPLGVTLPQTPPFELKGALAHNAGLWHLKADRATIGDSRLAGEFEFDTRPSAKGGRSKLSGRLNGPRLALSDLGPAVGTTGTGDPKAAADKPPPGRVLPDRKFDLPSLKTMDADVQVAIDELDFGSAKIGPFKQLRTHVLLDNGALRLQNLQAAVAGGSFGGNLGLDSNASPARFNADVRFATVDIATWLPGLKTDEGKKSAPPPANSRKALKQERDEARVGGDQKPKSYVTGALSGALNATGAGRSTAEILASLDGKAQLTLRDGTLSHLATEAAGLDVAQALGVLIRGDQPLPLNCARLDLTVANGVVKPGVALLDNNDTTVRFDGQLDLRDETLALRAVSKPKDISPFALRAPVTVKGTLANPAVGIEAKALAGKAAAAVALGAVVAPLAALLPFVDRGTKGGDACAEAGVATAAGAAAPPATQAPAAARTSSGR